jgi:alkanesulfonate monooxygenase SsuD/methylene tetrahydromethanopterin reductase-like flavin-dependent oxidoreductase (luciferase family)
MSHPVLFGLWVTPTADPAEIGRARRADLLGLDLLAVQDHPYQPDHLEMWTYLTHLAGQTERISLMPDVADLALRSPQLLAKAATSLDVLTAGRVELGVGAGGIPPAINAFGGPQRPPGEQVEAAVEALAVLRAGTTATGTAHVNGRFHHARGYRPGPRPVPRAPDRPVGRRPTAPPAAGDRPARRRLGLAAQHLRDPPEVPAANAAIDEGAQAAGRAPSALRRIYNVIGTIDGAAGVGLDGSAAQWAETLAGWHHDLGFDTFIFWPAANPDGQLERFANDVIPRTRALVAG